MENYAISCHSKKAAADNNNNPEAEENSWTFYIQEFMCENGEKSCFSYDYEIHFLLSDATSSTVKRFANKNRNPTVVYNNLKKKKHKEPEIDEDLVNTASSPVNIPKVR
ncbi:vascular-related protein 4 [Forsythia ovata]|uniref:Vascular-related protein 4 n=1 Tax=Forsythia ovata TaxID=205694 RepID=A0ABD1WJ22_9LAMI